MPFAPASGRRLWFVCLGLFVAGAVSAGARDVHGYERILQGPMLGATSPDSQRVWVRVSHSAPVAVRYGTDPWLEAADTRVTPGITPTRGVDFVAKIDLAGLQPATTYHYRVEVAGRVDKYVAQLPAWTFTTPPRTGVAARFRVAFGSCLRLQTTPNENIWRGLRPWEPNVFLWLGDNIYGDSRDPGVLAEEYRRLHDVRPLQQWFRSVPQLAIWDDHDFGLNNHDRTHPEKAAAYMVFQNYWANPSFGEPGNPGVYFNFNYGGMEFFLLDVRMHRDPNDIPGGAGKTLLGARQLAWLKEGLRRSDAPFKALVSGSGWNHAKGEKGDAWSAFREERDALFDFIRDENIRGVVLISGDTHMGELNAIPWSDRGGYDLYEFISSPLGQRPSTNMTRRFPEVRLRPAYGGSSNIGVLECDTTQEDPRLRFVLIDETGRQVWAPLEIRLSELRNGQRTWPDKIDPGLIEAQMRLERGEPYFMAD